MDLAERILQRLWKLLSGPNFPECHFPNPYLFFSSWQADIIIGTKWNENPIVNFIHIFFVFFRKQLWIFQFIGELYTFMIYVIYLVFDHS